MSDFVSLIRLALERGQAPGAPLVTRPPIERVPTGEGNITPPEPEPETPAPVDHGGKELGDFNSADAQRDFNAALVGRGLPQRPGKPLRQLSIERTEAAAPQALGAFASQFAAGGQGPKSYTHSLRPERGTLVR